MNEIPSKIRLQTRFKNGWFRIITNQFVTFLLDAVPGSLSRPKTRCIESPREAMLFAYTRNSAIALNEQKRIGSIAPGMQADLVLLDRDVLTVPPRMS